MTLSALPLDSEAARALIVIGLGEYLKRCDDENWLEAGIFIERAIAALSDGDYDHID